MVEGRCRMFWTDHSECLHKGMCLADPTGAMHNVKVRQCPNSVEKGTSFCKKHNEEMELRHERSTRLRKMA